MNLEKIDVKKLPELQGWKEKMQLAVKENPFVEIKDRSTYEVAKKHRTALRTARTDVQNQDKTVASKLRELRSKVADESDKLVQITQPHEEKQQFEIDRYEEIKAKEKREKEEAEKNRVIGINDQIEQFKVFVGKTRAEMTFDNIDTSINGCEHLYGEYKSDFDFQEFEPMFDDVYKRAMDSLNEKANELKAREQQRLENERLIKEAEKKDERLKKLQPYLIFIRDMDVLMALGDSSFDAEVESLAKQKKMHDKSEAEKLQKEEEEREKNRLIKEKLDKLEREKSEREEKERLAKEAEERKKREKAEKERAEKEKKENAERKKRLAGDKKLLAEYFDALSKSFPNLPELENDFMKEKAEVRLLELKELCEIIALEIQEL